MPLVSRVPTSYSTAAVHTGTQKCAYTAATVERKHDQVSLHKNYVDCVFFPTCSTCVSFSPPTCRVLRADSSPTGTSLLQYCYTRYPLNQYQ